MPGTSAMLRMTVCAPFSNASRIALRRAASSCPAASGPCRSRIVMRSSVRVVIIGSGRTVFGRQARHGVEAAESHADLQFLFQADVLERGVGQSRLAQPVDLASLDVE